MNAVVSLVNFPKKHRLSFCPDISISETMLIYLSGILKNAHLEPRDENNYWDFENKYGYGNSICTLNQKGCFLETVLMVVVLLTLKESDEKRIDMMKFHIFREIFCDILCKCKYFIHDSFWELVFPVDAHQSCNEESSKIFRKAN